MTYLSPDKSQGRIATFGVVTALQGGLALAVLSAFAGGVLQPREHHPLVANNYPLPLDPPSPAPSTAPSPAPAPHSRDLRPLADPLPTPRDPEPEIVFPLDPHLGPVGPIGGLGGDPGGGLAQPLPSPSPSAAFAPRAPRPLTAPGRWVSDGDYPGGAFRREEQGLTGFAVSIGPDGRVRDCTITRSSGSAELDAATCAKVSLRARFAPATDETGAAVAGRYTNAIRWQIPQ
jgi:protein TonB